MPESRRRSSRAAAVPDTVLNAVLSSPWAISETGLHRVLAIASRMHIEPDALRVALEQRAGEPLDNTRTVTLRDGIATIPLRGVMMQRGGLFAAISGATSYETIAKDLATAVADPTVRGILLAIDSPGGEVAGCHELWQQIMTVRGVKPIEAVIGGDGCSAAYWLASACDRIHVSETAVVGSLGARMSAIDDSRALRREGYQRIEIVSSQTPQKALDPAQADGRSRVQRMVDDLAAVFLASVATARGVSIEHVIANYGAGDVFVGARAIEAGLVDALGSYEGVHAAMVAQLAATSEAPRITTVVVPGARAGRSAASTPDAPHSTENAMKKEATKRRPATRAERTRALKAKAAKSDKGKLGAEEEEEEEDDAPPAATDTETDDDSEEEASEDDVNDDDEDVDASEDDEDEDEEESTSRKSKRNASRSALVKVRAAAATAERARILGILAYQPKASAALIKACIDDPKCSPAQAAQKILDAGTSGGVNRLRALRQDEQSIAASGLTNSAPPAAGKPGGLLAAVSAGYTRKRFGARGR